MNVFLSMMLVLCELSGWSNAAVCPTDCMCANQRVQCAAKQLPGIPEGIPADTIHLDLRSNNIQVIDRAHIKHLTNLQELLLGYNKISTIDSGTFSDLASLMTLNIEMNGLSSLPSGAFDGLSSLTYLYITNNQIVSLNEAFRNLTKLGHMDLSKNRITEINDNTFKDLKNLVYLTLENNQISQVSIAAFSPLQSLSSLVIKNNPIKNGNKMFVMNHRLSYIDLTGCHLKEVPNGLPWATQHLQLGTNNITRIRKNAFQGIRSLVILVLDENQITRVEKGAFKGTRNLEQLWLNDNLLKKIPSPFPTKVMKLYISKNKITKVSSKDFPKNSALTTLTMNSNMITSIEPGAFKQVKFLKELSLNGNKLFRLQENIFAGLNELETLALNNNKMTNVEAGALNGLPSLTKLEMAFIVDIKTTVEGNLFAEMPNLKNLDLQLSSSIVKQIVNSDEMLSSLTNLSTINLMNNELTTLSPNLRSYLTEVKEIRLAGNRWHCDKRLQWLSAWLKSHKKLFFKSRDIQCYTPGSLKGLPLFLLRPFQFAPVTSTLAPSTTAATTSTSQGTTSADMTKVKATEPSNSGKKPEVKPKMPKKKPSSERKPARKYRTTQLVWTKIQRVTQTQRFFVYASTTPASQTTDRKGPKKNDRKKTRRPVPTTHTTLTPITLKDQLTSKITKKEADYRKPTRKQTSVPKHQLSTTASSTFESSEAPPYNKSFDPTDNNQTMVRESPEEVSNSTENNEPHLQATVTSSGGVDMTTIIIATCVAAILLLIIIGVIIFFVIRYRQNKLVYHRALQYRQDYSDVVFFVGEPIQDFAELKQKVARSRSDHGSTSSRPSEDITNDIDTSMKVYTWDDE